jgi:phosphoglucomutase
MEKTAKINLEIRTCDKHGNEHHHTSRVDDHVNLSVHRFSDSLEFINIKSMSLRLSVDAMNTKDVDDIIRALTTLKKHLP